MTPGWLPRSSARPGPRRSALLHQLRDHARSDRRGRRGGQRTVTRVPKRDPERLQVSIGRRSGRDVRQRVRLIARGGEEPRLHPLAGARASIRRRLRGQTSLSRGRTAPLPPPRRLDPSADPLSITACRRLHRRRCSAARRARTAAAASAASASAPASRRKDQIRAATASIIVPDDPARRRSPRHVGDQLGDRLDQIDPPCARSREIAARAQPAAGGIRPPPGSYDGSVSHGAERRRKPRRRRRRSVHPGPYRQVSDSEPSRRARLEPEAARPSAKRCASCAACWPRSRRRAEKVVLTQRNQMRAVLIAPSVQRTQQRAA